MQVFSKFQKSIHGLVKTDNSFTLDKNGNPKDKNYKGTSLTHPSFSSNICFVCSNGMGGNKQLGTVEDTVNKNKLLIAVCQQKHQIPDVTKKVIDYFSGKNLSHSANISDYEIIRIDILKNDTTVIPVKVDGEDMTIVMEPLKKGANFVLRPD